MGKLIALIGKLESAGVKAGPFVKGLLTLAGDTTLLADVAAFSKLPSVPEFDAILARVEADVPAAAPVSH